MGGEQRYQRYMDIFKDGRLENRADGKPSPQRRDPKDFTQ